MFHLNQSLSGIAFQFAFAGLILCTPSCSYFVKHLTLVLFRDIAAKWLSVSDTAQVTSAAVRTYVEDLERKQVALTTQLEQLHQHFQNLSSEVKALGGQAAWRSTSKQKPAYFCSESCRTWVAAVQGPVTESWTWDSISTCDFQIGDLGAALIIFRNFPIHSRTR